MKKTLCIIVALAMVAGATAQEPKKKGGFMNALRKGVESATGLDVSDEALFVYPAVGEWKCKVLSCIGYQGTGAVELKITATKVMGQRRVSQWAIISRARVSGTTLDLPLARRSVDPNYDFEIGQPVEITFQGIGSVPDAARTLDVKFYIGFNTPESTFEARGVAIEWIE